MEDRIWYKNPARKFEEAIPLGNGLIGAMVYGGIEKERISLNHDTLWTGAPKNFYREEAYDAFVKAKELIYCGKGKEAEETLEEGFSGDIPQCYQPLGNIFVESSVHGGGDYRRDLDLRSGVAYVKMGDESGTVREYFISHPRNCMVIHLESSQEADYNIYMDSLLYHTVSAEGSYLVMQGACAKDVTAPVGSGNEAGENESVKFIVALGVQCERKPMIEGRYLRLTGEKEVNLVVCIETTYESYEKLNEDNYTDTCLGRLKELLEVTYCQLKEEHCKDCSLLYNRLTLDLKAEESQLDTRERLLMPEKDLGMYELYFNFCRYLIIASSRENSHATNLQGIWNENPKPPWCSNYTLNINTEMNYWPVMPCGLKECYVPMIEFVKMISKTGEMTAKQYYHAKGFVAHHNSDIWGHSYAGGNRKKGCCGYAFWNMSSGWLARSLYEYYEYTLDIHYLESTAYPIMKKAAEFYLDIMEEYRGGLVVIPQTSPENRFILDGEERCLVPYATMGQSIVADLFANLIKCCEILNCDVEFKQLLKEKYTKLKTFEIGSDGRLLEWDKQYEESDIHHRHVSHLYGLYPAELISVRTTPSLAKAAEKSLETRGDDATGWSLGWKVNLWTRLKNGERAFQILKKQLEYVDSSVVDYFHGGGTYPNLFDAHPPFQIDGNFAIVSGIIQMFAQVENGVIEILPALPRRFYAGSIKGVCLKGGFRVDIDWKDGRAVNVSLVSLSDATVQIVVNDESKELKVKAQREYKVI